MRRASATFSSRCVALTCSVSRDVSLISATSSQARTGTGKTLSFLTPAVESRIRHLAEIGPDAERHAFDNCGVLILSPTRELATQIANEARALVSEAERHGRMPWGVHLFVGGESAGRQLGSWERSRKDILVATPGRLKDFLMNKSSVSSAMKNLETVRGSLVLSPRALRRPLTLLSSAHLRRG